MWLQTIKNLVLIHIQVRLGSRAFISSPQHCFYLSWRTEVTCIFTSLPANFLQRFLIQTLATPWRASPWFGTTSRELCSCWQQPPWPGFLRATAKGFRSAACTAEALQAALYRVGAVTFAIQLNFHVWRCLRAAFSQRCAAITSSGDKQQPYGSKQAIRNSLLQP